MEFLRQLRQDWPYSQAVILTGFGDLEAAREAIHLDVADFLTKPCALGDLEMALARAFQRLRRLEPALPHPAPREWNDVDETDDPPESHSADSLTEQSASAGSTGTLQFIPRESTPALSMEDVERQTILSALEKHGSNRAAELGISLRKLYYRLAQYQKKGFHLPRAHQCHEMKRHGAKPNASSAVAFLSFRPKDGFNRARRSFRGC